MKVSPIEVAAKVTTHCITHVASDPVSIWGKGNYDAFSIKKKSIEIQLLDRPKIEKKQTFG